ncbi:Na+/H+ antiporter [Rhodococcus triatomae]|uniref:Monovalent cation:H+ antiporter, CPA1 family n=1 Tax=Rhodococcus triatomae TaxID=300028 RepID=A0A1G8I634_9NOCA|nr:cation:proton antiporter [Rhodococcus triatomae]QNG20963.1 Na+/H+ antiporter [Rhodococcus triatomae]QNG23122.1 Na+/H+ antiporter [Rhodococcus triatomae]SDI14297.1 monovalent cation:H+ antiporter, CPA1 family [Rhodococcus triatomae]
MEQLVVVIGLMLVTVLIVGLGGRLHVPWPVLLTLVAAGFAFLPGIPEIEVDPELILPLFLPPLLWALARRASWAMFRDRWRTIVVHSIGLVVVTTAAVAWTAWALVPGIALAGAIAIGAMTAPPDPVAVEAVAEPVGIPRRIVGVLQTEGLFNDAAALVAFQAALAATLAGQSLDYEFELLHFFYSAAVAVLIGLAIGWIGSWLIVRIVDPAGRAGFSLVIPFVVYLLAEEVHVSGVIAVVVAAVQMNSANAEIDAEDRLASTSFWQVAELLVTGVAFGLIGLEFRVVVDAAGPDLWTMVAHGVVIAVVLALVRGIWMVGAWQLISRGSDSAASAPRTAAEAFVMTWCGMRGLVTLALALSLPLDFAARSEAIVIAATVLVMSMIIPGATLPWIVRKLGVADAADAEEREEHELVERARRAALHAIAGRADELPDEAVARVRALYDRLEEESVHDPNQYAEHVEGLKERRRHVLELQRTALDAAQAEVLAARTEKGQDPHVVDRVLERLDRLSTASHTQTFRHH